MRVPSTRSIQRRRRFFAVACLVFGFGIFLVSQELERVEGNASAVKSAQVTEKINSGTYTLAIEALGQLAVRERVERAGYARSNFSSGWATVGLTYITSVVEYLSALPWATGQVSISYSFIGTFYVAMAVVIYYLQRVTGHSLRSENPVE